MPSKILRLHEIGRLRWSNFDWQKPRVSGVEFVSENGVLRSRGSIHRMEDTEWRTITLNTHIPV
jgi:hypothetical protein